MSSQGRLTRVALGFGITVRLLYFGSQVAAALVFPGYSFLSQSASQLGSDLARYPAVFNIGAIATGLATLLASWGFLRGLTGVGRPRVLAWATATAIAVSAFMHLWAGVFPMPNPRHGQNPFQVAAVAVPILIGAAVWGGAHAPLRVYFVVTILTLAVLMLDVVPLNRQLYRWAFPAAPGVSSFSTDWGGWLCAQETAGPARVHPGRSGRAPLTSPPPFRLPVTANPRLTPLLNQTGATDSSYLCVPSET